MDTYTSLNFNARSNKAKWNEAKAEIEQEEFDVCCLKRGLRTTVVATSVAMT